MLHILTHTHIHIYTHTYTHTHTPIMAGNGYSYAAAKMAEQEVLHPDAHVLFNRGAVQNEPDVSAVIMTQLLLKVVFKQWVEKGIGAVHSELKQLHMRDAFVLIYRRYLTK